MNDYFRPYEGVEPYIFVSYAHCNANEVLPIIKALHERKYRVWYDEGIAPGSEWPENIARHLNRASIVLIFVSKASLLSQNCENELRVAAASGKQMIAIYLDDTQTHSLLSEAQLLRLIDKDTDKLLSELFASNLLCADVIGDGITGYGITTKKRKNLNAWNLIAIVGVLMLSALGISLYGLNNGWFAEWLPQEEQPVPQMVLAAPTPEPTPAPKQINFSNALMEGIVYAQSGKEDLLETVQFASEADDAIARENLGVDGELKYKDLLAMTDVTRLDLSGTQASDLAWVCYLPALTELDISHTPIRDLTQLDDSATLKRIYISTDMPPVEASADRTYEIILIP